MITLTKRQRDMLLYLLSQEDYVTYNQCAEIFHISNRSVRYDMEMIEAFLKESHCHLSKKAGTGIKLICNAQNRSILTQNLKNIQAHAFNKKERQDMIIDLLLLNDTITFHQLAECCQVSKQTIINCFSEVQKELALEDLQVEKIHGIGLRLKGKESMIRRKFIQMMTHRTWSTFKAEDYIPKEYKEKASKILDAMREQCGVTYVNQKRTLVILSYLLMRIENHHILETPISQKINASEHVIEILKTYLPDKLERDYVATILFCERINTVVTSEMQFIEDDAYKIAMELVDSLSQLNKTAVNQLEMIRGLTIHLRSAIYRFHNHIQMRNEMLDQIKMSISLIYEFTRKKLHEIEGEYGLAFDENEIAYIAMYIASIYETSIKENTTLNIVAVCSFGLATSSILKTRIMSILPDCHMSGPMSQSEAIAYLEENNVDMVIATHECNFGEIPVIVVNPLLNQRDIERIKNSLFQLSYAKMCRQFILESSKVQEITVIHSIKDYIKEEDLQIIDKCNSWEEAIALAAYPLLKKGLIHQSYIDSMIRAVNDYGTYMVLTPKTAYVHAGIDDGIRENCTSMLVLRNEMAFGYQNAKMVRNIVVLGIKNKNENNLLNLVYILEKENNLKLLAQKDINKEMILNIHD